jgi:hypothetical protein
MDAAASFCGTANKQFVGGCLSIISWSTASLMQPDAAKSYPQ